MQKKYHIIILIATVIWLLCACQTSPEKSIVISKNDGLFESNLHQEASQEIQGDFPL